MQDWREFANAKQTTALVVQTTELFDMHAFLGYREIDVDLPASRELPSGPRHDVIESLERSLEEHNDVWAELANL
jgi:hypothetical protein